MTHAPRPTGTPSRSPSSRMLLRIGWCALAVIAARPLASDDLDKKHRFILDSVESLAGGIPAVGPFVSPLVSLLFLDEGPSEIDELREELRDYVDLEVLKLESHLLKSRRQKYTRHLESLDRFAAAGNRPEVLRMWKSLETMLNDEIDAFASGERAATPRLLMYGAVAQLHMDCLAQLVRTDLGWESMWAQRYSELRHTYPESMIGELAKVEDEREARFAPVSSKKEWREVTNPYYDPKATSGMEQLPTRLVRESRYLVKDSGKEIFRSWSRGEAVSTRTARIIEARQRVRRFYYDLVIIPLMSRPRFGVVRTIDRERGLMVLNDWKEGDFATSFDPQAPPELVAGLREGEVVEFSPAKGLAISEVVSSRIGSGELRSELDSLAELGRRADEELWPIGAAAIPRLRAWIDEVEGLEVHLAKARVDLTEMRTHALPRSDLEKSRDVTNHPDTARLNERRERLDTLRQELDRLQAIPKADAADGASAEDGKVSLARALELQELEARIVALETEVASLQATISTQRLTWTFPPDPWRGPMLQRQHDELSEYVEQLELLLEGASSLAGFSSTGEPDLPGVRRRMRLCETVRDDVFLDSATRSAWDAAIADVADPSGRYGLSLTVQDGLVPLGKDPRTGLWEFWHPATGRRPEPADTTPGASSRWTISDETALIFVLLPAGRVRMGATRTGDHNVDPSAAADESPVTMVDLAPFFLSKYEMTQAQWHRFRGLNPSAFAAGERSTTSTHPVESVSWQEAREVLRRLDSDLPTESQWEYACRAGEETPWWTGADSAGLQGAGNLGDAAYARSFPEQQALVDWDDGYPHHAPVGSFRTNGFGLHDIVGNVAEWCRDALHGYDTAARDGDGLRGDAGASPDWVVSRGGAFFDGPTGSRSAARRRHPSDVGSAVVGVRPMLSVRDTAALVALMDAERRPGASDVRELVQRLVRWADENRELAGGGAAALAVFVLGTLLLWRARRRRRR